MTIKTLTSRTIVAAYCFSHSACFYGATADEHDSAARLNGDPQAEADNEHEVDSPSKHEHESNPEHEGRPDQDPPDETELPAGTDGHAAIGGGLLDMYVLEQSLEMIDKLEIRRGERTLLLRTYGELQEHKPLATAVLQSEAFWAHWQHTFAGWLAQASETEFEDARAILTGLASYFVGVNEISIGPRCAPVSSGYVYGFVQAGVPGDSAPSTLASEILRSENESRRVEGEFSTRCITDFQSRGVVGTNVIIRLPADATKPLTDGDVWKEEAGARLRVGVPVPKAAGGTKWHQGIDPLLLAQNLDHLAEIEIRRGERQLVSKPQSTIEQYKPISNALTLTREAYLTHWRDTFWAWIYQNSNTAFEDAEAILHVLSGYAIGASQVSVGPRCSPVSASYTRGIVGAGAPGDGVLASLRAEIARSEQAAMQFASTLDTHCSTAMQAEPDFVGTKVVVRLPAGSSEIGDLDIWNAEQGPSERAGVLLP